MTRAIYIRFCNTIAKISEMRAVEYHAFFVSPKKKAQKETTAHARDNNCFAMFKPMS
jgi:hypothetical protein